MFIVKVYWEVYDATLDHLRCINLRPALYTAPHKAINADRNIEFIRYRVIVDFWQPISPKKTIKTRVLLFIGLAGKISPRSCDKRASSCWLIFHGRPRRTLLCKNILIFDAYTADSNCDLLYSRGNLRERERI